MICNNVQFKGRSLITLLLAVFMLALAATPALAWVPEDNDLNGQPVGACRVIFDGAGELTVRYFETTPQRHNRVVAAQPLVHPAVARAELMSVVGEQLAQVSAK